MRRFKEGPTKPFEERLGDVVVIHAGKHLLMQGHTAVGCKGSEKLRDRLGGKLADSIRSELALEIVETPSREIKRGEDEGFVHRSVSASEADNRVGIGERLSDRFANDDPYVLDRVVVVHAKIAFGLDSKVELAMESHQLEHVIEEGDPSGDVLLGSSVEVEHDMDAGFGGFPIDFGVSNPSCALAHCFKFT